MKIPALLLLSLFVICDSFGQNAAYKAFAQRADSLFHAGRYLESGQAFSSAFENLGWKGLPEDRFWAARAWSLAGNMDSAFFQLNRLLEKTDYLENEAMLLKEPDFAPLYTDFRWKRLTVQLNQKLEQEAAVRNSPLAMELERIRELDQWYRVHWDSVIGVHGRTSPEFNELLRRSREQDSLNVLRIIEILDTQGWPGPELAGKNGSRAIWLVIQHADLSVQEKYLPMMRQAVAENKASSTDLAYLEDRVLMREGKPQIYGSQIVPHPETGAWMLYKVEDPDNLDRRRATVGLGPIQEYLDMMGARWER